MRTVLSAVFVMRLVLAQGDCRAVVTPNSDHTFLVGSSDSSSKVYRWLRNGQEVATPAMRQLFLLHADGSLTAEGGQAPLRSHGVAYEQGRWGQALALTPGGAVEYARANSIDFNEGTLEMWVAMRADGTDADYASRDHALFQYYAANGDGIAVTQSGSTGVLYAGGRVAGQVETAYSAAASTRGWNAGEWHHVAFTWSAAASSMRFYLDGVLAADSNEKHYWPPPADGERFALGDSGYRVDEVRVWADALDAAVIHADAQRLDQPRNHETWLPRVPDGDTVVLEAGVGCASRPFVSTVAPLTQANPPSTLLAAGTTSIPFSVVSAQATSCGYSVGTALAYGSMTAFESGQGGTAHSTTISGLSPNPAVVNSVYVRCASDPTYTLSLQYRSIPSADPPFPRKGNLWGSTVVIAGGIAHADRINLYLGSDFTQAQIRALRAQNPDILILTSINTVENSGLSEDYYLHDVHGKRIEVWPGTYRLNMTKAYVAEYQAQYAYQKILNAGLLVDGCFFDNFFTTQSWLKQDIYGNAVQIDADEDGQPDDPQWLDSAWHDGVYHELNTWRQLMPNALATGHLPNPPDPEFTTIFNGASIGFFSAEVADGTLAFQTLWDAYQPWWQIGRSPVITMMESAPPYQISYGYGYSPLSAIPSSTLEFARTYYPYVRFGLAFTLMNDGYFAHEFGDTWHGNDWWYDELNFDLGFPLGPAERVNVNAPAPVNLMANSGFESVLNGTWDLAVTSTNGAAATVARDTSTAAVGSTSARVTITNADGTDFHINLEQINRKLQQGVSYDLTFWAKSDSVRTIAVNSQRNSPDWRNYGLYQTISIGTEWKHYSVTFLANETVTDARIEFFLGAAAGRVWLDDAELAVHPPDIYRRDFENGAVLLNGTRQAQTIEAGREFSRISGKQAARYEAIIDDSSAQFSSSAEWHAATYDSGMWMAAGPYYHTWGTGCHQLDGTTGSAQWALSIPADDTYTIDAWWPAAPQSSGFSQRAVFEVVAGGSVVSSTTLDQTSGGDQWHRVAVVALAANSNPTVRLRNAGSGSAIADALHVYSASRYNDGSPAATVTLAPMDGIVLSRNPRRRISPIGR